MFVSWSDVVNSNTPLKFLYFYTNWCEDCEKQEGELRKIYEYDWREYYTFTRINADERPDIAIRYSPQIYPSISIISQNSIIGGTFGYTPHEKLLEIMLLALDLYRGGGKLVKPITTREKEIQQRRLDFKEIINVIRRNCLAFFDIYYGGFEKEPKYYLPNVLEFLLNVGDEYSIEVVKYTLDAVIYNLWDDGFYAYAKKYDWKEPSKVKLIDLNSKMVNVLFHVYEITHDDYYLSYAVETANWLLKIKKDDFYPTAIVEGKPIEPYTLDVNSQVGEALMKAYKITGDKKYLDESKSLAEKLKQSLRHNLLDPNSPLFLIDLAYLLNFLSEFNDGEEIIKLLYEKFYGGDAFYDITLGLALHDRIGRFKLITDNSILAQGLVKLGRIEDAKKIAEYFSSRFYNFAYFSQADYGNLLVILNERK